MESLVPFIIQIITGVIGGEAVGAAFRHAAMGQVATILSGAIGGLGGGAILGSLTGVDPAAAAGAMNGILTNVIGGAGGGAILTAIVGAIMSSMNKTA